MQLRRIEIRDFRKLGHAVIDDLGDGLSVIVGDNEAGKSTVLAALRAVLFERHRVSGKVAEAMLPYGQNVRPEVAIEFDLKGARWRLRKAFNQRQDAELVGPQERITGDAVEDRLAELFAFTPPGRGESKREEHQGLYGLLWVEQGRSHHSLGVGGGKDVLASAIESEVGQVIGGERGRALLAAAAERNETFWSRNDKPKGDYRALLEQVEVLKVRRGALAESLRQHDAKVEALVAREEALARHAREDRLTKAITAVKVGQEAVARAAAFEQARDQASRRLESCGKDLTIALERRQRRNELIRKVEAAQAQLVRAEAEASEARRLIGRRQGTAEADEKRSAEAREARRRAERHLRLLELALEWRRRSDGLSALDAQLAQAEGHGARRRDVLASVAGMVLRPKDVAELDDLQRVLDEARSDLRAASVEIDFAPDGDRPVTLDGAPINAGEPLRLSRDATLRLEGYGRLTIRPGGGVEALARAHEEASRQLGSRLDALGVATIAEARSRLAHKAEAEAEAGGLAKLLHALAPQGIDALRQNAENERAALAASLPPGDAHAAVGAAAVEEARRERDAAATAEAEAEARATLSRDAREHDARELAVLDDRVTRAQTEHESRVAELAGARLRESDDALRERLADHETSVAGAEAAVARTQADLMSVDAETARLDLDRAEQAERSIRADIGMLAQEKRDLEIELGIMGRNGLGEELSHVDGELERLERDKAGMDREAAASRLLLRTLVEAQRESKDRWLGPIRERVKPYLRFLQPESDIVLNEQTLEIEGIVRNGVSEPFHALSMGAREQMAVITRLALADILRDSGQPSALILDDALVNTDAGRLVRMRRVLQTAAKSLQVLVLTCRENDFVGLGEIRRL